MKATAKNIIPGETSSTVAVKMLKGIKHEDMACFVSLEKHPQAIIIKRSASKELRDALCCFSCEILKMHSYPDEVP